MMIRIREHMKGNFLVSATTNIAAAMVYAADYAADHWCKGGGGTEYNFGMFFFLNYCLYLWPRESCFQFVDLLCGL